LVFNFSETPLHSASSNGHISIVECLINHRAAIDVESSSGFNTGTPLHCAVRFGHIDVVEYLISQKASIHLKNTYGETSLDLAVKYNQSKIIEILSRKGKTSCRI